VSRSRTVTDITGPWGGRPTREFADGRSTGSATTSWRSSIWRC